MKKEKKFKRYKNHIILNPEWVKQNHPETYDIITGKLKIKLIKLKKKVIKWQNAKLVVQQKRKKRKIMNKNVLILGIEEK